MSKRLIIDMDCGNAAFTANNDDDVSLNDHARRTEAARILREVAEKLEGGYDGANLRDYNGNLVGVYRFINGRKNVRDH